MAIRKLAYRRSTFARFLSVSDTAQGLADRASLPRLVVVGYVSVDYMCSIGVLPHRDDRITADHIEKALGGPAANVAVAAAAVGMNGQCQLDLELATVLGDDPDSDWAIAELEAKRVRAIPIRQPHNNRLSRCIVMIESNGSRTIINEPFELSEMDLSAHYDLKKVKRTSCLHVEGHHFNQMRGPMSQFRKAGWKVAMHCAGLSSEMRKPEPFLGMIRDLDLVFANDRVVRDVFGIPQPGADLVAAIKDALSSIENHGVFVLTLGAQGAMVFSPDLPDPISVPALAVTSVDTTGAGDSFAGAFLAQWLHGQDLETTVEMAAAAGSLTVTAEGAQGVLSSFEDLRDAISKTDVQKVS